MNKNELVKNLKKDIQEIYSITNGFENQGEIHQIDIDLALSKVRNLYELLLKLNPQATYTTEYQKEEISTTSKKEIKTDKKEPKVIIEPEEVKPPEIHQEPIPEPELIIEKPTEKDEITEGISDSKIEEIQQKVIKKKQNGNSPEIVADKFQSKKFVHDNIVKKNIKKDVSTKMQTKPIKDINSAIGLNDKFIFIRELFGNNKDHYHETIQVLNNFDTFDNALEFLNDNFDWESEDPNFERLKELVRRKYAN